MFVLKTYDLNNIPMIGSSNEIIIRDLKTEHGVYKRYDQWIKNKLKKGYNVRLYHTYDVFTPDAYVLVREL